MKSTKSNPCQAWQLLVKFFFTQRADLPTVASEFELSPAQCHVLHLIEPDRLVPMGRLAEALACDASNVTGLVDRLESRGLVRRQPSPEDRRVKVLRLTPTGARLRAQLLKHVTGGSLPLSRLSLDPQPKLVTIPRGLQREQWPDRPYLFGR